MKALCIISGILLLIAIPTGLPYSYYQLLRLIIFLSSITVAIISYKSGFTAWTLIFGAIAFLFNIIAPIYLSKSSWVAIDLIAAVLFFISAYSYKRKIP